MNAETARIRFTRNFTVSVSPADSPYYHGWPTVANMGNGVLAAVCSGFREAHICPFGRVTLFRSADGGRTWDEGTKLTAGPLDDRDAGITLAADGSWLVNYFTSTHGISVANQDEMPGSWKAAAGKITLADLNREHGFWMLRSADRGLSWSKVTFLDDIITTGHEARRAYLKGFAKTANEIRKRNLDLAAAGSPAADEALRSYLRRMMTEL